MYLAPLNYDKYFNKVFSHEGIARRFLEDFLETGIEAFEMLKGKHRVTDDAALVEFDFRCKIENAYVILDMQQWYKRDVTQRFYLYHALNTGLQLEKLPSKRVLYYHSYQKTKKIKDYRALEPVITLVWMVDDTLGFKDDYVAYTMSPETVVEFIKNDRLWHQPEILEILKERAKVLEILNNKNKELGFLSKNRLIFLLQKNIVKNQNRTKYGKWFEFAEKTKNPDNKEEDFRVYQGDEIFGQIIKRLNRKELNEDDFLYIENEKKIWEEVERFEQGIFQEGMEKGEIKGEIKGEKKGEKNRTLKMAKILKAKGVEWSIISEASGLTEEEIKGL